MKQVLFVVGFLLLLNFSSINVFAQVPTINTGTSGVTAPTGTTTIHTMNDDGHVHVPLQFGFPYFGKTFTNSIMYDNGVVGFFAPATETTQAVGCNPATNGWCGGNQWSGQQFTSTLGPSWNYMIAPLHTDLIPRSNSVYSTTGDSSQMTYRWQNVGEYYNPNNLNTFSLQIKPSGFIGANYENINIGQSNVSVGLTGNLANNEFAQHYWRPAGTVINNQSNPIPNWNILDTGVDLCVTDPLSSTTCPGYAAAYLSQQCSYSALYSPSCPGYQSAFFTQQCNANQLYSQSCPGYAAAFLDQQCSLDPLYSTTCSGYSQAYFNLQCSLDGLYNTTCPNYADAYYVQQCTINPLYDTGCTGYETAYFNQQCSLNSLYNSQCPGYADAYFAQQCSISGLYSTSCPNYASAFFSQQCSLNGLYNTQCPNYAEAYATKLALDASKAVSNPVSTTTTTVVEAPKVDSSGETKVAVVADSNVNAVITSTATSASPAAAATATVPLVAAPAPAQTTAAPVAAREEKKEEKKETATAETTSSPTTTASSSDDKKDDKPKTTRQEIQERRQAAARANAIETGKNLANSMGQATSMEQQAAVQNVVIQAMGFTPGFDAYGKANITDVAGYKPYTIYNNQRNVDNRFVGMRLFGGTDRLHSEMVDAQYSQQ
jgi:hypothetical protein